MAILDQAWRMISRHSKSGCLQKRPGVDATLCRSSPVSSRMGCSGAEAVLKPTSRRYSYGRLDPP